MPLHWRPQVDSNPPRHTTGLCWLVPLATSSIGKCLQDSTERGATYPSYKVFCFTGAVRRDSPMRDGSLHRRVTLGDSSGPTTPYAMIPRPAVGASSGQARSSGRTIALGRLEAEPWCTSRKKGSSTSSADFPTNGENGSERRKSVLGRSIRRLSPSATFRRMGLEV